MINAKTWKERKTAKEQQMIDAAKPTNEATSKYREGLMVALENGEDVFSGNSENVDIQLIISQMRQAGFFCTFRKRYNYQTKQYYFRITWRVSNVFDWLESLCDKIDRRLGH